MNLNKFLKLLLFGRFQPALNQLKLHTNNHAVLNRNKCLALAPAVRAMNMNRQMLVRVERDHNSEIFVEFWHGWRWSVWQQLCGCV